MAWWRQPFIQIALPISVTFIVASWSQNKRLDDIVQRLTRIEALLTDHGRRLTALEERTSPLRR
jgi:hypothetical protein